jgi:pimeloyl-ACP methyl ester carboxylesterase
VVPAALPIPRSLHVATLLLEEAGLTILASVASDEAPCPLRSEPADCVHSRYVRTLADLPWAALAVRLRIAGRQFFCDNPACPRRPFAERLTGIALAHARRTDRQRAALTTIAFANGGEEGARVAAALGYPVSPDILLRLIRAAPEAEVPTPAVLGVNAWAYRKGRRYGTIAARAAGTLRPMPLVVLSHGRPATAAERPPGWPVAAEEQLLRELQGQIARLVPNGRHLVAEGSGHDIHQEQPAFVIDQIRAVVEAVRDPSTWATPVAGTPTL